MRTLVIAGLAMVTAISATPATAQRTLSNGQVWHNGRIVPPATVSPNPPRHTAPPGVVWNNTPRVSPNPPHVNPPPPRMSNPPHRNGGQWSGNGQWAGGGQWNGGRNVTRPGQRQHRWGGSVGGRWYGGSNAPGGWNAYRRPNRGWTLPRYWIAPSFFISDFGLYGLSTPPRGYNWTRYYDDAVLTDSRGRVYDSVGGIDWDSYGDDTGYADDYDYGGGGGGSAEASAGYGYAAAAAAGGGGGHGAGYAPPVQYQQGPQGVQGGYSNTYQSGYQSGGGYAGSGGYASGGYWYPPVTTTTITVQSAPVVTTTTTEYVETSYRSARRVYRAPKRVWRPKSKVRCAC